jgi:hypothetical protein
VLEVNTGVGLEDFTGPLRSARRIGNDTHQHDFEPQLEQGQKHPDQLAGIMDLHHQPRGHSVAILQGRVRPDVALIHHTTHHDECPHPSCLLSDD